MLLCLCPALGLKLDHLAEARFAVRREQVHQAKAPTKENLPQSTWDPDATSRTAAGGGVNAQGSWVLLETSVRARKVV